MKLLYICNEYPPAVHGGIGTFVRTLARRLVCNGHEVAVIGLENERSTSAWSVEHGVRILRLAPEFPSLPRVRMGRYLADPGILAARVFLSQRAARLARDFQPDIVESYDWSGPLWFPPCRPLVVRLHGAHTARASCQQTRPSRQWKFLERRNVRMADALVAASQSIGTVTVKALDLDKRPFRVIYNGVDPELFAPHPRLKDPLEILYVGTIHPRKGLLELFRALPRILDQAPGCHLTLVGRLPNGGQDDPFVRRLLELLPPSQRSRVCFVGHLPHEALPATYSRAAVAVFPSRSEGFGLVCAEAMSCQAAVVMTAQGSGPELVEHERSGLLADPSDTSQLVAAVVRLLRDHSLRQRLGEAGRKRVLEEFNLATVADRNLDLYQELLADHQRKCLLQKTA